MRLVSKIEGMALTHSLLLCELHAHTTWSDGALSVAALVELGAALVGAHPYPLEAAPTAPRTTARYAAAPEWAANAVDRFELVNRHDVFEWVARARLPVVASGDFHRLEHLATWKTLVPCALEEDAIVEHLRSG